MAIDPAELAKQQDQRSSSAAGGSPTKFATSPDQQGVQIAGGKGTLLFDILKKFGSVTKTLDNVPITVLPSGASPAPMPQPQRIPTPQEKVLVPQGYDPVIAKQQLAQTVLSPAGAAEFTRRGLIANPDTVPAQIAQATEAAQALETAAVVPPIDAVQTEFDTVMSGANDALLNNLKINDATLDDASRVIAEEQAARAALGPVEGADGINFDLINTQEDVKQALKIRAESMPALVIKATGGRVPVQVSKENAAEALADFFGTTKRILNKRIEDGLLTPDDLMAGYEILGQATKSMLDLENKILSGSASQAEKVKYINMGKLVNGLFLQVSGNRSAYGRGLNLQRYMNMDGSVLEIAKQQQEALKLDLGDLTVEQIAARSKDVRNGRAGVAGFWRFHAKAAMAKTSDALAEAYLSGMLSSMGTQNKNIGGTVAWMNWQLAQETLAGLFGVAERTARRAVGSPIKGDQVYMQDSMFRLKGWLDSFGDALRVAKVSFVKEAPANTAKAELENYGGAMRSESDTMFGKSINIVGQGSRIFLRTLTTADEFFKTISQRGELYVRANHAYRNALNEGKTSVEALDEAGMVLLSPDSISEELDAVAKYNALQDDIGALSKGAGTIQQFRVGPIPIGRLILPFAQTPANALVKGAGEAFPIFRIPDLASSSPAVRQRAMAKITMAAAFGTYIMNKFAAGDLTGSMPSDKAEREALLMAKPKWQPNSIVFRGDDFPRDPETGDFLPKYAANGTANGPLTYFPLNGFEPVGGVIALYTSIAESREEDNLFDAALAAVSSTYKYYSELPMLQGLADLNEYFDIEDSKDFARNLTKFARTPAEGASFLGLPNPVGAMQRSINRLIDPTRLYPREDLEYWTLDNIQAKKPNGTFVFSNEDGTFDSKSLKLVGRPKGEITDELYRAWQKIKAMAVSGSWIRDDTDLNAPGYDTLGQALGREDTSFAINSRLALWNLTTGIRVRVGEKPDDMRIELARIWNDNEVFPLSNPRSYDGMQLSRGVQSDFVNIAKNEIMLKKYGDATFREALDDMLTQPTSMLGRTYEKSEDPIRIALIRKLEDEYYVEAWRTLLLDDKYANLRQAAEDREQAKGLADRLGTALK